MTKNRHCKQEEAFAEAGDGGGFRNIGEGGVFIAAKVNFRPFLPWQSVPEVFSGMSGAREFSMP